MFVEAEWTLGICPNANQNSLKSIFIFELGLKITPGVGAANASNSNCYTFVCLILYI